MRAAEWRGMSEPEGTDDMSYEDLLYMGSRLGTMTEPARGERLDTWSAVPTSRRASVVRP